MTKEEFDTLIETLVTKGIEITIKLDTGKIVYDLNTAMKSHLYLHYDAKENLCRYFGRYENEGIIADYNDLLWEVKGCLHGRDFGDTVWIDLLIEERVLGVVEEVTTTRKFK